MNGPDDPRAKARVFLSERISKSIAEAFREYPEPRFLLAAVPQTLAGLAGAYAQQFLAVRAVNDGEMEKLLAGLVASLKDHADPSKNPPDAPRVPEREAELIRRTMRGEL